MNLYQYRQGERRKVAKHPDDCPICRTPTLGAPLMEDGVEVRRCTACGFTRNPTPTPVKVDAP